MVDLENLFENLSDAGVSAVSFGILRFTGYEESKKMFEETARMTVAEALKGKEDVVTKLNDLIQRYEMGRDVAESKWKPDTVASPSLDSFC